MIKGLPEKLQELRAKYGYSQKQVADLIKVSPSVVSGYETGERTPSTEVLLQLANIYKCSTDYLLGKDSTQPPVILDTSGLTDAQIQAIQNLIISIREKR
ncbi:MAG: helix-turn-helix transcriptional regulator [Clostridia bacterium]|nr:helix-turn-helix transcriptional regulator [Clostridia bacterium]